MDEYCVALNDSNPVAVVLGGRYDGRRVSIAKKDDYQSDAEEDERDPFEQLDINEFLSNLAMMDISDRMRVVRKLKSREDTTSKYAKKYKESCKRELKLDAGQFVIMPTERTERVYIAGKSGVGKSTLASMYIREYTEMFPDRKVILISTHTEEKAYEMFNIIQIPLDDSFIANPPELNDLKDALVIFDDTDNLTSKKLSDAVKSVNNNLIANGRKYNIHVITMSHQLMDYSRTRHLLNEANRVIFFLGGSAYHNKRYLSVYAGLDKSQINRILALKSRWVCLGLTIPNYFISQHEVGLIV